MVMEKGSLEGTKVKPNDTPEFDNTTDVRATYFSSKRISSSSPPLSDDERSNVVEISMIPKVKKEIREPRLADLEKNGVYDREAILHYLVNSARSENGGGYIYAIIRLNTGSAKSEAKAPKESSKIPAEKELSVEEDHDSMVEELRETLKAIPDSLLHLSTGWVRPGDSGLPPDQKPDWLDMDKLKRGQKFAQDYLFAALYTSVVGLLPVFSFDDGLKPMIITGRSSTPFTAFRRYLSAGLKFRSWFTEDSWKKGTGAWKDMSTVRAMHVGVRRKWESSTNEEIDAATAIPDAYYPTRDIIIKDFVEACEAPVRGQCPYILGQGNTNRSKGLNQVDMAITQWSFAGLLVLYPHRFGVHHAADEDLEAFCHLWRSLGYQLGIEDEYNFYRGTLEDVRKRGRELLDTWIKPNLREITPQWEHMSRSLITGMASLMPCITFEMVLVNLMETLDLPMPRLYASFSYLDRIIYNMTTGLLLYGMKVPGVTSVFNAVIDLMLNQAQKYTPDQLQALRIKLSERQNSSPRSS